MSASKPRIAVIGSINMDLLVRCGTLPRPGETILANSSAEICGGKGANQAVAAARAGGDVTMVGRIGDDAFAGRLLDNLQQEQIDCQHVRATAVTPSGLAIVAVESSGQNSIMVVPGANGRVAVEDVQAASDVIRSCDTLLVQLEVPLAAVVAAKEIARAAGVRVILDPAPSPRELPAELSDVDLICPNESEASALTGLPVESVEQAEAAARALQSQGACAVVITMGTAGSLLLADDRTHLIEPFAVDAIDTTAAGDAFAGALAVHWAQHGDLHRAVRFANAGGALAASREGAQPAMATCSEIEEMLGSSE